MSALLLLLQEPAAERAMSPFDINTGLILWTVGIFVILMAILWRFAWPTILKSVVDREQRIQRQLDEAEKARVEAQKLLEEHKKMLAQGRAEAQEIIAKAKSVAQKEREILIAKTHEEQEQILVRARREIEGEKDKAIQDLRREAVDLSMAAASRLLEKNLTGDANRKLVTEYLASIEKRS